MTLIVDSHEDLAWNMQTFGRDYTRAASETRELETDSIAPQVNGDTLLGYPDYVRGRVAVIFATLFAAPIRRKVEGWDTVCYEDENQAYDLYRSQLDLYHRLVDEHADKFTLIQTQADLSEVLVDWQENGQTGPRVGLVTLMEGAEGIRDQADLEEWWQGGVRWIGLAWAGNRYCGGTGEPGGLTAEGYALLANMHQYGFGLDLSHMDVKAALQALDVYPGTIVATHSNALALLKGYESNRHLPDEVIRGIIERQGVIGILPANAFLLPGWKRSDGRELVSLERVVAHIDYICQMSGDARHVGIGTDFDGGFGLQHVPRELDTVADLKKLEPLLEAKGYTSEDIELIMGKNWLRCLRKVLPLSI